MKFIADTHAHTLASGHAYSTIREMAAAGAEKGLQILALTEHAPEMPGTCQLYYFQNLDVVPREINGLHMLFGTELNIMDSEGNVDLPEKLCKELDIVVASMHSPCFKEEPTIEAVTKAYVETMKKPYVNIIGHPDDGRFPIDYEILVKAAKETKTLLELNNSSLRPDVRVQGALNYYKSFTDKTEKFSYEIPLTRQQLASLTALRVETVIRTVKKLEKDGALKIINRKIFV